MNRAESSLLFDDNPALSTAALPPQSADMPKPVNESSALVNVPAASTTRSDPDDDVNREALDALRTYYGYDSFRNGQNELISGIMSGRDVLGVMPTGSGKSVCYQIPAILLHGVAIVVSPLISLMRDQVDNANEIGISAAFINSTQTIEEQDEVFAATIQGGVRLLYVSPERLQTQAFQAFAARADIAFIAVDEAHCVSQWGQNFRPSYLAIHDFVRTLPVRPPIAAFTATATDRVRADIIELLDLQQPQLVVTGFDRTNLYFDMHKLATKDKNAWILDYVRQHLDESGIIYCATRKETEELSEFINANVSRGINGAHVAASYHGGMDAYTREQTQRDFVNDRIPVIVATNAFGMGIDKSNVRYVIHHNMPESIEAYYQEAGRAGRDGEPSTCTLLWNDSDIVTRRRLMDMTEPNERLTEEEYAAYAMSRRQLLNAMIGYCRTADCLHAYMTHYFGDTSMQHNADGTCVGGCVNCECTFETVDVSFIARSISKCVSDVHMNYGVGKIVDVLRGSKSRDILERGLDHCSSYAKLQDVSAARIRDVLNQMSVDGYLTITEGRLPLVQFGPKAADTVHPEFHYEIKRMEHTKPTRASSSTSLSKTSTAKPLSGVQTLGSTAATSDDNPDLFEQLRALRLQIAQEIGKPPYIVFSDKTLHAMASMQPTSEDAMLAVSGVGPAKLERYGEQFLSVIRAYVQANA